MSKFEMKELVSMCKHRGFIFQSSEIYGGINGFWDYGPYGVELKNAVKRFWWDEMVTRREDVVGQDAAIIMHPRVWEASGHVENFNDPMIDCKACKSRFREDHLGGVQKCPDCGGELTEARMFNLMLKTSIGASTDSSSVAYLRPETAQAIFTNFKTIQRSSRKKLPMGIAQIGKAFRNEITPRNFTFRSREFEQMEMQYFVDPEDGMKYFDEWLEVRKKFFQSIGIPAQKIRLKEHGPGELAHYARKAFDIEVEFPFGWQEVEGIHHRGDFDLSQHEQFSGEDMKYFDEQTRKKYVPHVVETSIGADRLVLALLCCAYRVETILDKDGKEDNRTVLGFSPKIAPVQVAVFPLVKKLRTEAKELEERLRGAGFRTEFDVAGQIGKRYRRQDEIGTPFCVTFDYESLEDGQVTIRERDTMEQHRVPMDGLDQRLRTLLFE
jgi:glycyl-tRNA synthetase